MMILIYLLNNDKLNTEISKWK